MIIFGFEEKYIRKYVEIKQSSNEKVKNIFFLSTNDSI